MVNWRLKPHPDFPSMALDAVGVSIDRRGDVLSLRYMIEGDVERVRWPEPAAPARADELWQHSCFEAFVQPVGRSGYVELNLSPSGRWASYAFDGRREGMRDALVVPVTAWAMPVLTATADLREIGGADWRIGLTMVVEAIDGTKSFWALTHAPGPPDFHNPDCFIATLPAPDGP